MNMLLKSCLLRLVSPDICRKHSKHGSHRSSASGHLPSNNTANAHAAELKPAAVQPVSFNAKGNTCAAENTIHSLDDESDDEDLVWGEPDADTALEEAREKYPSHKEFALLLEAALKSKKKESSSHLLAAEFLHYTQSQASIATNTARPFKALKCGIVVRMLEVARDDVASCDIKLSHDMIQTTCKDSLLGNHITSNFIKEHMKHLTTPASMKQALDTYDEVFPRIDEDCVNSSKIQALQSDPSHILYIELGMIVTHLGVQLRDAMVDRHQMKQRQRQLQQAMRAQKQQQKDEEVRRILQRLGQAHVDLVGHGVGVGNAELPGDVAGDSLRAVPMGPASRRSWKSKTSITRQQLHDHHGDVQHHPKQHNQFDCLEGMEAETRINTRYFTGTVFKDSGAERPCWNRTNDKYQPLCGQVVNIDEESSSFEVVYKKCKRVNNGKKVEVCQYYCQFCTARFELC